MIYREATIADIPQLQFIRGAVKENILSDPALVTDSDVEIYITQRGKGWVSETENGITGFAIADLQEDNIWALFIHPDFEGQGIGKRLHDEMLNWYFNQNKKSVWLSTTPGTRAEKFYRRAGWKETGNYGKGEIKFEMGKADWVKMKNEFLQLNFSPFPQLETERLFLKRVEEKHTEALFFLRSDETVLKYIGREPAQSVEEIKAFIKSINETIDKNESVLWGIHLKDNPEKLIGTIGYWRMQPQHFRAEVGYILHPNYWQKGIMKEALLKIIGYGFQTMQLHSIEARLDAGNTASAALLHAAGFVQEAYFREDFYFRGKFADTRVYSLVNNK